MEAKDWINATEMIRQRNSQVATVDSSQLNSLRLSELSVDQSRPPTHMQEPYIPLSTSTPIYGQTDNPPITDNALEELPY